MEIELKVLKCGSCEPLKLAFHGTALGLAAIMGLYNAAAWLSRRQRHLAVNAVLYAALTAWEQQHVAHHLYEMRRVRPDYRPTEEPVETAAAAVALPPAA